MGDGAATLGSKFGMGRIPSSWIVGIFVLSQYSLLNRISLVDNKNATYSKVNVISYTLRQVVLVAGDTIATFNVVFVVVIFRIEQLLRLCHGCIELNPISACFCQTRFSEF
jgi:hypothetical protein